MDDNIQLRNRVTIISGFPAIGKSTVEKFFRNDLFVHVYDLDSSDFRAVIDKDSDTPWETLYATNLKNIYNQQVTYNQMCDPNKRHTIILLTPAHESVRNAMSIEGLPYVYAVPTEDNLKSMVERARIRYEQSEGTDRHAPNKRAYDFIQRYCLVNGYNELGALKDTGTRTVARIATNLLDWVMDHLEPYTGADYGKYCNISNDAQIPLTLASDGNCVARVPFHPHTADDLRKSRISPHMLTHMAYTDLPDIMISKRTALTFIEMCSTGMLTEDEIFAERELNAALRGTVTEWSDSAGRAKLLKLFGLVD